MKKRLRELLEAGQFEEVADIVEQKRRLLGTLVSLTFDPEPLIAWRAVEAMGLAADRIAAGDANYVRGHLRRLHWLISEESGGVCWYSPQAIAEIARRRPAIFPEYVSIVVTLLKTMAEEDLGHFRAGVLWGIGRLGEAAAKDVEIVLPSISASLDDPDSQIRGLAAWCLGEIGQTELLEGHEVLLSDDGETLLYGDGELVRLKVREIVRGALSKAEPGT